MELEGKTMFGVHVLQDTLQARHDGYHAIFRYPRILDTKFWITDLKSRMSQFESWILNLQARISNLRSGREARISNLSVVKCVLMCA